ncbi:MAG: hypothetical protein ACOCVZ_03520 [Gemmatimonadota bacterium]
MTLATDDGELRIRARWKDRAIDLQRRILFLIRQGQPIFLEDEWGHGVCLRPECVWAARVEEPAPREGRPTPMTGRRTLR